MHKSYEETLNCISKCLCGTTKDDDEAGYILTDGTLLDFSGAIYNGTPGHRIMDHSDPCISKSISATEIETSHNSCCTFMNKAKAIRFSKYTYETDTSINIDMIHKPNTAQLTKIKQIIARSRRPEVYIDKTSENCDNLASEYNEFARPDIIDTFVEKNFNQNI